MKHKVDIAYSKYKIITKISNLEVISAQPDDIYCGGPLRIPKGSYIFVPEKELELFEKEDVNGEFHIFGYSTEKIEDNPYLPREIEDKLRSLNLIFVEEEKMVVKIKDSKKTLFLLSLVTIKQYQSLDLLANRKESMNLNLLIVF